jgi:hypothetical protein
MSISRRISGLIGRSPCAVARQTGAVDPVLVGDSPPLELAMNPNRTASRRRALRLYFAGQGMIVLGAAAMAWMHSFAPMALAASAGLMLTVPLVRDIASRRRVKAKARARETDCGCE